MYLGTSRKMNINRNIYCSECRGSGAKDGKLKQCTKCKGKGVTMQNVQVGFGMQMQMQVQCPTCQGKGQTMAAKCPHCKGKRLMNDNKQIDIEIERGMANGDTILMEKEGEQVPDMTKGDLVFTIKQKPNKKFRRVGNNLFMDMQITLEESLMGFSKTVDHLDGHKVKVETEAGEIIQPDQWLIIKGQGMPLRSVPSDFGDLHIKMKVKIPQTLTASQKEIIKTILPE